MIFITKPQLVQYQYLSEQLEEKFQTKKALYWIIDLEMGVRSVHRGVVMVVTEAIGREPGCWGMAEGWRIDVTLMETTQYTFLCTILVVVFCIGVSEDVC